MDELEMIKHRADSWYELLLIEVDKAVRTAVENAATSPSRQQEVYCNRGMSPESTSPRGAPGQATIVPLRN